MELLPALVSAFFVFMRTLSTYIKDRILVLDGAMGTMLQSYSLDEAAFRSDQFDDHPIPLQGNSDILSLTQPHIIRQIHSDYLSAGADIIETNTFGAHPVTQTDYQLLGQVYSMNFQSARIAREICDHFTEKNPAKPRFACGILGPTNRTASISPDVEDPAIRNVTFDQLAHGYALQTKALIEGGVHLIMVETVFDTLNCKAALFAARQQMQESNQWLPLLVSGTITDASGRILSGQTVDAFYHSVEHANLFSIGLNCALGAEELRPFIQTLSSIANTNVSIHPNAGLPDELGNYQQSPENMAAVISEFAREGFVNMVGGCCGTTPDHIQAISKTVSGVRPRSIPALENKTILTGLETLSISRESLFINIGERTNMSGSARFRKLINNNEFEQALTVAKNQIENGANILDINMDEGLLDSEKAMETFLRLIASDPDISRVPLMIDSSNWSVLEVGLKNMQGKGIVNSISLKDGEEEFLKKAKIVRDSGAAVVVMAFDEQGQADSYDRKIGICTRSYHLLVDDVGYMPEDIILDPNIFAVATGLEEHNEYAHDYLRACKTIKETLPGCKVSGGVSNLSFAFRGNNAMREAIHSVFLYHAIQAGMDMGIVNAGQLAIYEDIPETLRLAIEDVLFNRSKDATENLLNLAQSVESSLEKHKNQLDWRSQSLDDRISFSLIHGVSEFIKEDMLEAVRIYDKAVTVIEKPLMQGMSIVGDLFGNGKMFLPQVVKSARVMKKAVAVLTPFIESEKTSAGVTQKRPSILLATVKGDVHDIGKNIVSVVLACNNYDIIDLGVMVPAEKILSAAKDKQVDMIGLSGLITASLHEMTFVASELEREGFTIPLLIGGATTSKLHTAVKIAPNYSAPVIYVTDASRAVNTISELTHPKKKTAYIDAVHKTNKDIQSEYESKSARKDYYSISEARKNRFQKNWESYSPPEPVFKGIREFRNFPLSELVDYIDWTPFFHAWQLKGHYPEILDNDKCGPQAQSLFQDAQKLLEKLIQDGDLKANGVAGLYPANARGDDIEIYTDESRTEIAAVSNQLRQQMRKSSDRPNFCLADFIAPAESNTKDWIGAFAVTAGLQAEQISQSFLSCQDDYSSIMTKLLADRLAEAFAEKLHEIVRTELWGYAPDEQLSRTGLITENYSGIRPAPGYPACPDHSEKTILFKLLNASNITGITLTESYAMFPAASVCGWYFSHPESAYFGVGKINADQLADYAIRKGIDLKKAGELLTSNLN